jgi:superkiller protein 3
MAWISYRNRDYEGALSYLAHARDLKPNDPRIHLFFGMTCVELNLSVDALASMEKAVSLDPDNPFSNYVLGSTVMKWREPAEAIPYLKKYTDARPDDPKGQATLGEAYFLNKEYQKARNTLAPLVAYPDTEIMAHFYVGVIDRLEQNFDSSLAHLNKVIELEPDHPDALAELGALYTRLKQYDKATEVLNRALQLDPDHYQANFNLLTLYSRTRDERYAAQKDRFEKIKEERWQSLTESLRTVEVVPHQVFPELLFPGYSRPDGSQ